MRLGSAVQTNGLGSWWWASMKRSIAACRSTIERNTPRLSRRRVSLANRVSMAFSHEHEVGVKWNAERGWRASQARTVGCWWVP
jgi:hypothetical protein